MYNAETLSFEEANKKIEKLLSEGYKIQEKGKVRGSQGLYFMNLKKGKKIVYIQAMQM